jgi:hypothetical protein
MDDPFQQFCNSYQKLAQQITLIQPSPRSDTPNQVFERYENAYRIFLKSDDIPILFHSMDKLRTIFVLSEMMDNAYLLKYTSSLQFSSFLYSYNPNFPKDHHHNSTAGEFFDLLEEEFKDVSTWMEGVNPEPNKGKFLPPFTYACFQTFVKMINDCEISFRKTSKYLLDIHFLKGFVRN